VSLINTVIRARTYTAAMDDANDVVQRIRQIAAESGAAGDGRDIRILGPAPPPLGKLRGEYRAQLLLKGGNRKRIREALQKALAGRPDITRRTVVDVDPLSVL
jgi:primosomal protein N' (replication factor Y)